VAGRTSVGTERFEKALGALGEALREKCPTSARLYERARKTLAAGVTHDSRFVRPFPVYFKSGRQARKTDADGNEYIDYWVGHGSLILGHGRPEVVAAVREQLERGTHLGGCHELEVEWGERALALLPAAERIRFAMSGTEAVLMALRLARAHTGRELVVKFHGHFHGWSDYALVGADVPFDVPTSRGAVSGALKSVVSLPANDLDGLRRLFEERGGEIAAVILEPTGGQGGAVPTSDEFLSGLRAMTREFGATLIFDEVITGFRVAPGGAQAHFGIEPDLTCLAKILAGGFPGGAVAGRAEILDRLDYSGDAKRDRRERVSFQGTHNGSPISAAAGIETLKLVAGGRPGRKATEYAAALRAELNALFAREGLPWCAYGRFSIFHLLLAEDEKTAAACRREPLALPAETLRKSPPLAKLRKPALWLEGVDLPPGRQAWTTAEHGEKERGETVRAFAGAIRRLRKLGAI